MNMIYRETLKNGLRIVGETMENYRSVSVGVWIGAGSVFERTPAEAGVSHFAFFAIAGIAISAIITMREVFKKLCISVVF